MYDLKLRFILHHLLYLKFTILVPIQHKNIYTILIMYNFGISSCITSIDVKGNPNSKRQKTRGFKFHWEKKYFINFFFIVYVMNTIIVVCNNSMPFTFKLLHINFHVYLGIYRYVCMCVCNVFMHRQDIEY